MPGFRGQHKRLEWVLLSEGEALKAFHEEAEINQGTLFCGRGFNYKFILANP